MDVMGEGIAYIGARPVALMGVLALGLPIFGIIVDGVRTRIAVRRRLDHICGGVNECR